MVLDDDALSTELHARNWFDIDMNVYCDPAGGERIQEITNGVKSNNSVDSGVQRQTAGGCVGMREKRRMKKIKTDYRDIFFDLIF
jgi:hypothetical protein